MQYLLLAVLPAEVTDRLSPHLTQVSLHAGEVLHDSGQALQHVYFPADGVVSLVCETRDGKSVEVAIVGNEGLVGVEVLMGGRSTTSRAIVLSACKAYRLPTHWMMVEFNRHGELMVQTLRYAQSLITQMAQNGACNRHHSIDQQLCRRLLVVADRSSGDRLGTTHEQIASMLGVRRESITGAAHKLQSLGVIACCRGQIHIIDRARLEKLSCECYAAVRKETLRLQPYLAPAHPPIDEQRSARDIFERPRDGRVAQGGDDRPWAHPPPREGLIQHISI